MVCELVAKRTVYSTTYLLSNGHSRLVLSQKSVHFRDKKGDWQNVETAFRATDVEGEFAASSAPVVVQVRG
ncbi:MAG: hypothetical protein R2826_01385 [Thermoleophilia bacterium]